ncbi:hypothetical protein [Variovorax sp. RB3P1]|uniref:hypothetical protein n=1 Tax=Variovorax sp. RB3P1 TaxID=3443732 RepID=UPI003F497C1F
MSSAKERSWSLPFGISERTITTESELDGAPSIAIDKVDTTASRGKDVCAVALGAFVNALGSNSGGVGHDLGGKTIKKMAFSTPSRTSRRNTPAGWLSSRMPTLPAKPSAGRGRSRCSLDRASEEASADVATEADEVAEALTA